MITHGFVTVSTVCRHVSCIRNCMLESELFLLQHTLRRNTANLTAQEWVSALKKHMDTRQRFAVELLLCWLQKQKTNLNTTHVPGLYPSGLSDAILSHDRVHHTGLWQFFPFSGHSMGMPEQHIIRQNHILGLLPKKQWHPHNQLHNSMSYFWMKYVWNRTTYLICIPIIHGPTQFFSPPRASEKQTHRTPREGRSRHGVTLGLRSSHVSCREKLGICWDVVLKP